MSIEAPMMDSVDEERVFRALSDSHRRELLELLLEKDGQTLSELDAHLPMTRFGTMKHLRMLEAAGLVVTRRAGRRKLHFLEPGPLRALQERWLARFADPEEERAARGTNHGPRPGAAATEEAEIFIRATPERIWEAITRPEYTLHYHRGTLVHSDWRRGSPIRYALPDGHVVGQGALLEIAPPRRLVHSYTLLEEEPVAADPPHKVTWTIEPRVGACRVALECQDLAPESATWRSLRGSSSLILSGLKTLLETGEPLHGGGRVAP